MTARLLARVRAWWVADQATNAEYTRTDRELDQQYRRQVARGRWH